MTGLSSLSRRSGFTLLELVVLLGVVGVLTGPLVARGVELRSRFLLANSVEEAAALLTRARWIAVRSGGAEVGFVSDPPAGWLVDAAGDTLARSDLGSGGVALSLSGGRGKARVRFGPLGLGVVASQTLRFAHGGRERSLIVSSLGRLRRR